MTNEYDNYDDNHEGNDEYEDYVSDLGDINDVGEYSLEAILAEYKGSAFINGEKKTPKERLNEEAARIIKEEKAQPHELDNTTYEQQPLQPIPPDSPSSENAPQRFAPPQYDPHSDSMDLDVDEVEKAIDRELGYDEDEVPDEEIVVEKKRGFFRRREKQQYEQPEYDQQEYEESEYEQPIFYEPELKDAAKEFFASHHSMALRTVPAAIITAFMVILTFAFEAGMIIPFGIGRSHAMTVILLMISLMVVMMLYIDIIIRGLMDILRGVPNVETLLLFSCVFSLVSGIFVVWQELYGMMVYSAVSALSLTFAALGEKYNYNTMAQSLLTAASTAQPFGLLADYNSSIEKTVLKKAYKRTDGFYSNLIYPNISEKVYRLAAPLLLIACLLMAVIVALFREQGAYFPHILSALLAAAAPFSAILAFAIPFKIVAKSARDSGAAIAGWGGADEICNTDGSCVTDEDLFPQGTVSFGGVKIYNKELANSAVIYTASLIITSGCGLKKIFAEALKTKGDKPLKVEDFVCQEGGIVGRIHGRQIMTGNVGFMNLIGIKVEDSLRMKNAIYTAIDKQLAAMFIIEYVPTKSVQSALISILKWRIKLYFAVRDFNVTPLMLEQKFEVSLENFEYLDARNAYEISELNTDKYGLMAAVLTRGGLGPFAEAVTVGRLLKASAKIATIFSVFTAAFGIITMFYLFWMGAFISARPGNLIIFMFLMFVASLIVCGYSKIRK